jgi:hypothetical protein
MLTWRNTKGVLFYFLYDYVNIFFRWFGLHWDCVKFGRLEWCLFLKQDWKSWRNCTLNVTSFWLLCLAIGLKMTPCHTVSIILYVLYFN